ncbi:MAG: Ni/Fe-hydrogenase cytochrome b subunit [Acidobacteria bacterium]|uniref:Ni/Fe-hydrogenase cytochrome b subunit n=1 Tax=Candidatus Polarisedimenticola svalbardensis TaxID=2886004 RepID=A0A8J6XUY4_9BACT|nr:Ni/Fe-hydrogenase cytochrome b subunit [Candidatus Polarisedimenticola svalbardensis]
MTTSVQSGTPREWDIREFVKFVIKEAKPRGKFLTPFNMISIPIILVGAILVVIRFVFGIGSITNLSQSTPWGIWIGFDVVTGVAFAGGAYVVTFLVYILGAKQYHSIVRVTVLNGFLAYMFYAGALMLDLGRPWKIINPIIGNSFGVSSVLFLVAWHFLLYMAAEFIEFSPAIAEWLGWPRLRKIVGGLTIASVIFGITLSTLHQSGLGALFLMAKSKIHPLWFTEFIPVLFFISSIFAGLSMVIFEGSISHKVFRSRVSHEGHADHDAILLGLAKICAGVMFVYFFLKVLVLVHSQQTHLLATAWGVWFMVEVLGFVLVPGYLFFRAVRAGDVGLVKVASALALVGIILNRLNISVIAYEWYAANPYIPSWMEIEVTAAVICVEIWAFRWVVTRMPVLSDPPSWAPER